MDLSALIFVALAVAWAVYLIPKALKQHEASAASRSIEGFSDRMRVLARREPVDTKTARLVVTPGRASASTIDVAVAPVSVADAVEMSRPPLTAQQHRARRAAAARAAQRRLRVVLTITVAIAVVGGLAIAGVVDPLFTLLPVGLLAAWLVACRVLVKRERAAFVPATRLPLIHVEPDEEDGPRTEEITTVPSQGELADVAPERPAAPAVSGGWDPVPVTLPTYVAKEPAARRSVRTIDLDSTGVWSSGPSASDSALAREAEDAERAAKAEAGKAERRRATGSGA